MHYSKASMYRCYYQRPQEAHGYDVTVPTTRFGSSPNKRPAVGIGEFHIHTNCIMHAATLILRPSSHQLLFVIRRVTSVGKDLMFSLVFTVV